MKLRRPAGKRWRIALSGLLVLAIGAVALFEAWQSFCAIPNEIQLSGDFHWYLVESNRAEATLLRSLHSEMSKKLAWLGTIGSLQFNFDYVCQPDSCFIRHAIIHMSLIYFPACAYKNAVSSHVVTGHFGNLSPPYIEPPRTRGIELEPAWATISSDISIVREYALDSVGDDKRITHPNLYLNIIRSSGDWMYFIHGGSRLPEYRDFGRLEDSDILRIKEEKK